MSLMDNKEKDRCGKGSWVFLPSPVHPKREKYLVQRTSKDNKVDPNQIIIR